MSFNSISFQIDLFDSLILPHYTTVTIFEELVFIFSNIFYKAYQRNSWNFNDERMRIVIRDYRKKWY